MIPILLLTLRTTLACVASRDPEEILNPTTVTTTMTTTTVTLPPPCAVCPQGVYREACNGTELICNRSEGQWRTFMGLIVEAVSCMGPPLGCNFCPTAAATYADCTTYGRITCLTLGQTSSTIVRDPTDCKFIVICAPGTTANYVSVTGVTDTLMPSQTMTCPFPPGPSQWNTPAGAPVTGITCMSNP
ncbi:unnamed protein product [Nippostrongylus brasiliensis]|uniref:Uncharacterized protein n=1 Tax=Nippostrongylus brasiliensis TaxID=27835 RepID=A0A0N4XT60_NIPBR|nr:unnamed protein product [Nippostrongylus brasiliensis]